MMRAFVAESLHPDQPGRFLVLHVPRADTPLEHAVAQLGNEAYEGEDAFHLLTSQVGFRLSEGRLALHTPDGVLVELPVDGDAEGLPVVLLVANATLDALVSGEAWPIVIGPWSGSS